MVGLSEAITKWPLLAEMREQLNNGSAGNLPYCASMASSLLPPGHCRLDVIVLAGTLSSPNVLPTFCSQIYLTLLWLVFPI